MSEIMTKWECGHSVILTKSQSMDPIGPLMSKRVPSAAKRVKATGTVINSRDIDVDRFGDLLSVYIIILNGGSTGSRLSAFKFFVEKSESEVLILFQ